MAYEGLLRERAVPLGLVSAGDQPRLWERHILDSVRGVACLPHGTRNVVDVGSGAGLPGVPMAICRPDLSFALLEPRSRRAAFLELVTDTLALGNVRVVVGRAESWALDADLCLARAVASPAKTWRLARSLMGPGGRLLLWAGRSWPDPDGAALRRSGVSFEICVRQGFPWEGPLVIIGGT
jgi:16S rRNA (guanine527-N7)-methyltransferase